MTNPKIQAFIDRMNWIGSLPESERERLRAECVFEGHTPSGERFLTTHPIHVCLHCASEFYLPDEHPMNQAQR